MLFSRMSQNMQGRILFLPVLDDFYCVVCFKNRGKLLCKTSSHSAQSHCFINTDLQESQRFWIFVDCEQQFTELHKHNPCSMVISWSAIRSQFLFSVKWVTCDILSFKTVHLNYHHEKMLDMILTRNSLLQNFEGDYHVQRSFPDIPVTNQTHPIQNSYLFLLIKTILLSSNQYEAA
jgi:hypothetical protein